MGQPRDEGQVRRLLNEAFLKSRPQVEAALTKCFADPKTVLACVANEPQAMAAMARRWASTRYVQDMWELMAKLEGELSKDAGTSGQRVSVIVLNNTGKRPLGPEIFREAARRKVLEASQQATEGTPFAE